MTTDDKNHNHYPDFEPSPLGDLKDIKRTPEMAKRAPRIRWGDDYNSWSVEKRLGYAEALAASMNHAADILQQERNTLRDLAEHQEKLLRSWSQKHSEQGDLMTTELGSQNAQQQELYQTIVDLQKTIKEQAKTIKELQADNDALGGLI